MNLADLLTTTFNELYPDREAMQQIAPGIVSIRLHDIEWSVHPGYHCQLAATATLSNGATISFTEIGKMWLVPKTPEHVIVSMIDFIVRSITSAWDDNDIADPENNDAV